MKTTGERRFNSKLVRLEEQTRYIWHICIRVSIPNWFDQKASIPVLTVAMALAVSIPNWFDQKYRDICCTYEFGQVSIPNWFDQKKNVTKAF